MRNWVLLTGLDFDPVTDDRATLKAALDALSADASRKMTRGSQEVRGYYAKLVDELAPSKRPQVEAELFDRAKRHRMADDAKSLIYGEIDRFAKLNPGAVDKIRKNVRSSVREASMIPDWDIDEAVVRARVDAVQSESPDGPTAAPSNPVEVYNRYMHVDSSEISDDERIVQRCCAALGLGDLYRFLESRGLRDARTASDSLIVQWLQDCRNNPQAETQEHGAAIADLSEAGIKIISSGYRQTYDALLAKRGIGKVLAELDLIDPGGVVPTDVARREVVELVEYTSDPQEAPLVLLGCVQSKGLVCGAGYDELMNAVVGDARGYGARSSGTQQSSNEDVRERARREYERANQARENAANDAEVEAARKRAYERDYGTTTASSDHSSEAAESTQVEKGSSKRGCIIKVIVAVVVVYLLLGVVPPMIGGLLGINVVSSGNSSGSGKVSSEIAIDKDYQGTLYPASTSSKGSVGYIGKNGRWVIKPSFTEYSQFNDGLALQKDSLSGLFGYINTEGDWVIDGKYKKAGDFQDGLAWVQTDDGKYQYIDTSGNVAIAGPFDSCSNFGEGLAWVVYPTESNRYPSKYSIIDKQGSVIVAETTVRSSNKAPGEFHNGLSVVSDSGAYGFANTKGEIAIKPVYAKVTSFGDGAAAVYSAEARKWGYIDTRGKTLVGAECDEATLFHDGHAIVEKGGKTMIIGTDGSNVATDLRGADPFNDGLASAVDASNKLVLVDVNGTSFEIDSTIRFIETYPSTVYE